MLILLTNDDGVYAPGLKALKDALEDLGELWVVAPAAEQSGVSHAFSLSGPLRVEEVVWNGHRFGLAVNGTPVDAVKLAVRALLPKMPDLIVSGINRGENSGVDLFYSGTVAGAMEAALLGIPAIAISQSLRSLGEKVTRDPWGHKKVDYAASMFFARKVCEQVIANGLPKGTMLNVNVPLLPVDKLKGVKITRQAASYYIETLEKRRDPRGVGYLWKHWQKALLDDGDDSDVKAVDEGYVSITPIQPQLTDEKTLDNLQVWKWF